MNKANNQVRIIGGRWRSRTINLLESEGLRPTPNRVRETLFNWLSPHIVGAHCLDAFAGSGALGFEALSRGAASITFCEAQKKVASQLKKNSELLNAQSVSLLTGNFLEKKINQKFDIIFLDPPFHKNLVCTAAQHLMAQNCLAETAVIYVEVETSLSELDLPEAWQCLKSGKAGDVQFFLYQI
jgi:16S rRNA (guanine966-N2)-methyltransferase